MLSLRRHLCFLLGLLACASQASEDTNARGLIQQMFPKATVIGERNPVDPVPVWPVYQLNEVIGYAFESNDIVDFPGFSGERINLLIGLDTKGEVAGLELLHHHEPIFLHGLGPQPFLDFLDQYKGHSVAERIIVGPSRAKQDETNTYFDGVTKATVSVIVANDTILNSALQVARNKLSEYVQRSPAVVREDHFEPLNWDELVDRKLVRTWRISRDEVEIAMDSDLASFPDPELTLDEGSDHITLYYAYLNPPTIGRNLLGEAQHNALLARLRPGENAFLVMSEGFYNYLPTDYRPGTVPGRISLVQNGLPISIRDTNFVDGGGLSLRGDAPTLANLRIFRTRPQAGLDPSAAMQLQLQVEFARNHLVTTRALFHDDYILPSSYFERVEVDDDVVSLPLWARIWQARAIKILVLCAGLAILTAAFYRQRSLSSDSRRFHAFRWAFLSFTVIFIGFYTQGQLSVVNIFTVQLALMDGFDLGVFLLDPVIFILWLYTFVSLFLVGRGLFCGWLCPFGALQEALAWLAQKLRIKQIRVGYLLHRRLLRVKYLILLALVGLAFYSLGYAEKAAEIEPFKTVITLGFIREWPFVVYAVLVLGLGLYIHKFYCRYLCPLGAGLAILGKFHLWGELERRDECGSPCQLCRHRCEIGAIRKSGGIDYNECIQCLECVVILQDNEQCAPQRVTLRRDISTVATHTMIWIPENG